MSAIQNKYDIFFLLSVKASNPNGDPDADNMPRQFRDEVGHGYITDVCLKRKIRDYVLAAAKEGIIPAEGNEIYIQRGETLDSRDAAMAKKAGIIDKNLTDEKMIKAASSAAASIAGTADDKALLDTFCSTYYDVRTFGAVMTLFAKARCSNSVNGPVQFEFAESVDPVMPEHLGLFRCAVTKEEKKSAGTTFGDKYIIPYGLYRGAIHVSALNARTTGFSEDDLKILLDGLATMFEHEHSASHGDISVRKIVVCKHDSAWGSMREWQLKDVLQVKLKDGVQTPTDYSDYDVTVNTDGVHNVTVTEYI